MLGIFFILLLMWALGMISSYTFGGAIHLLPHCIREQCKLDALRQSRAADILAAAWLLLGMRLLREKLRAGGEDGDSDQRDRQVCTLAPLHARLGSLHSLPNRDHTQFAS